MSPSPADGITKVDFRRFVLDCFPEEIASSFLSVIFVGFTTEEVLIIFNSVSSTTSLTLFLY